MQAALSRHCLERHAKDGLADVSLPLGIAVDTSEPLTGQELRPEGNCDQMLEKMEKENDVESVKREIEKLLEDETDEDSGKQKRKKESEKKYSEESPIEKETSEVKEEAMQREIKEERKPERIVFYVKHLGKKYKIDVGGSGSVRRVRRLVASKVG
jgi:hypothetical protein